MSRQTRGLMADLGRKTSALEETNGADLPDRHDHCAVGFVCAQERHQAVGADGAVAVGAVGAVDPQHLPAVFRDAVAPCTQASAVGMPSGKPGRNVAVTRCAALVRSKSRHLCHLHRAQLPSPDNLGRCCDSGRSLTAVDNIEPRAWLLGHHRLVGSSRWLTDAALRPIGATVNPLLAIGAVLATMVLAVLATMVVENWRRLVTPAPRRDPDPVNIAADSTDSIEVSTSAGSVGIEPGDEVTRSDALHPDSSAVAIETVAIETVPFHTPAGAPDGAVAFSDTTIAIRDPETADVLAGLLFAGLASTRRSGADRAAAWVTAAATPPSADPERLPQGVRLRGRSAKVAELLGHHDGGCVWVTLQPGVDIARGLARTPVTQPTLAGLVEWWRSTRTLPSVIESSTAATIADAVEAVRPQLDHTPWSEVVGRLHDALARCAERDESILVSIGIDAEATAHPGATGHAGATGPQTSVVVSDGPTRAARRS